MYVRFDVVNVDTCFQFRLFLPAMVDYESLPVSLQQRLRSVSGLRRRRVYLCQKLREPEHFDVLQMLHAVCNFMSQRGRRIFFTAADNVARYIKNFNTKVLHVGGIEVILPLYLQYSIGIYVSSEVVWDWIAVILILSSAARR